MKDAPKPIIIDASVVLKWIIFEDEPLVERALSLRQDFLDKKIKILVPNHFFAEIGNVLGRKLPHQMLRFFSELKMTRISEYSLSLALASLALELMGKYPKISFYDAVYHALAIQEKGIFVTADKKYFEFTKKEGAVQFLSQYAHS